MGHMLIRQGPNPSPTYFSEAHTQRVNHVDVNIVHSGTYIVVLCLSHSKAARVSVPAPPLVHRVLFLFLLTSNEGTIESNLKDIAFIIRSAEQRSNVHSLRNEHVVGFKNFFPVKMNGRVGVESIECKNGLLILP
ncbi:hypothetical protein H112_02234 [Trichophyton rubrum D6]|uniref:Uncharacterized protein n=3 Tax=Trichophyton TaxID=5550 RepID=A0A080WVN8_TRIRC|nr:uncharacterized protein TERG_12359 [Trichophyton rubrum CBS 118892]EZF25430.1 hypothetical protein H100_02235 [Trichophyton rubrum MR850]EZF44454.1 hypothetical protein H102_02232 [Trichophyton rubrum CBS 100081]EZF55111.1 hypothetical protein H103_02241 [Trichophyton rubrum CBS 288.86]EZF65725.1 hypothetical protein H104_02216 [Trichophyton rubrum CBS 289.86]EZF76358.1 hypothetical protein H105_02251 [Trichophyton soudanense CBS 452.61]EZF87023.1 hypothetical protein H110_02238 [Trichophy